MEAMHIRRPGENSRTLVEGFKSILKDAMHTEGNTMRVVFRKRNGEIRTMDVAFDAEMLAAIKGTGKGSEKRAETNERRGNLVVRERIKDPTTGELTFRWRTIPLSRVLSLSPCL